MADTTINFVATFKAGAATAAVNSFKGALHGLHGAVSNVAGKLKDLGVMVAKLAVGAGVALVGLLSLSAKKADEYGITVARVAKITGLAVDQSSRLVAVFQRYGVEGTDAIRTIGMLEKNVGKYTLTTKASAKFAEQWGFSLRDANGHVKDANALISQAADYFNNKSIPASKKAALEASLFGRNWQQIVPILALGSKGIKDAGDEAAKLGLVLDKNSAGSLAKFHQAGIQLGEAWGGFQLQLGLFVMPILTKLFGIITDKVIPAVRAGAAAVAKWLSDNKPLIDQLTHFAGTVLAHVITALRNVIGWILSVVKTIAGNKDAMNVLTTIAKAIGTAFTVAWQAIQTIIGWIAKFVDSVGKNKTAMTAFRTFWDGVLFVLGKVGDALQFIIDLAGKAIDALSKVSLWQSKTPQQSQQYHAPQHAAGGWVGLAGPELSWVGEKGPEYIIPNDQLGKGVGTVHHTTVVMLDKRVLATAVDEFLASSFGRAAPTLGRT
jgi:hypothetical protein